MAGFPASNVAAAGVVTTSTAPARASCAIRGVVSTTSPRKEVWITRFEVRAQSLCRAERLQEEAFGRGRRWGRKGFSTFFASSALKAFSVLSIASGGSARGSELLDLQNG